LDKKRNASSFESGHQTVTSQVAIMNDITTLNRAEQEVLSSRKLRTLTAHLQKTREAERSRIAREIHDELGQVLATVQMGMSMMAEDYRDHQILTAKIRDFDQLLAGAIKTVQRISAELRPQMLDTLGLGEALDWQASEFQKRTGIDCTLEILLQRKDFPPDVATAVFRIVQETLTNVMRHSEASRVILTLHEKRDRLVLMVRDNGKGITRAQSRDSRALGIMGMKERAYSLGGRLKIFAAPEKGTVVIAHIPA
jgi:signal transduction histidine kinase